MSKRTKEVEMCGFWVHPESKPEVMAILASLRTYGRHGARVRLILGEPKTGRVWPEEYNTMGYIGRSIGEKKIPLLIANTRSTGGGAILTHCILGIIDTKTHRYLYKADNMDNGVWEVREGSTKAEYSAEVWHNGSVHARFKTIEQTKRYRAFMALERHCK